MKRLLSVLLVVTLLFSSMPVNVFAESAEPAVQSQSGEAAVNNDNLTISGSNPIGELLAEDIQQEQASAAETLQTGYDVVSLTVENNIATVEFYAKDAASVVVAIYSNDRSQLLTSCTANVTADETEVTLELPDTLPEYFHASAYMVNPTNQKPLCTALHTSRYTKEIQELLQSTIYDYDSELVLNLDEQTDTNFAVYNEDTVVVQEQTGANTVVSVDDDNLTYVIGNPSQEIRCLMYGDVLSLPYGDEDILFVKVDRVDISGNTATITGLPIEMQDVFSHVKIDGDASAENAVVDTETADEGVTFEGSDNKRTRAIAEGEVSLSRKLSYKFSKYKEADVGGSGASAQINGSFDLEFVVSLEYYVALFKQELKFTVETSGTFSVAFEGEAHLNIPLGRISIPVFAGILVGFEPELVFEIEGKAELSVSVTAQIGFTFVTGDGFKNISEPPKSQVSLEIEATFFAGVDLAPQVCIIDPSVGNVTVSVPIGAEVTAKMTGSSVEGLDALTENNHTCTYCVDIGLDIKFEISVKLEFLKKPWLTWELKVKPSKWHVLDAYYSIDHNEFGFKKCPYRAYPLTITVLNSDDQPVAGAIIECSPEDRTLTTKSDGKVTVYLPNGEYALTATKGDYAGSANAKVDKDSSVTVDVVLTGDVAGNVKWSLTEAGALTIFGNGAIPNYTNSSQLPWSSYISRVKSVFVSDGITGIGANAFRDHTNLTSVYIGNSVSSIAFPAFEGANLSSFAVSSANPYYTADQKGVLYNKNKTTLYKAFVPLKLTYDIPDTVTNIASAAFAGQTGVTLIHFPGNAPTIASDAFSGMTSEALYCTRTSGWTQDKLQQYGGTITWSSYDGLLGSGTTGNQFTWQVYNDGVLRISGNGQMPNYTSASQTPWYKYRESIKEVVLSRGITTIGDYSFAECTALETITIPAGVTTIGNYAFYNCSSLPEISVPEDVSAIGSHAFYNCSSLQDIDIPESVTEISSYTFYNCSNLQEVPLHNGITTIGQYAFYGCSGFRELVIPKTVTEIGTYAFASCSGALSLRIRENSDPAFAGLTIGTYAFRNCRSLRTAEVPDSTIQINESIFSGCGSLESIRIPFIGPNTATSSKPLGHIFGTSNYSDATKVEVYKNFSTDTYYVPASLKTVVVSGGEIVDYAFFGYRMLQNVILPETATVIGRSAFQSCIGLQDIIIPDGVTVVGASAFYSCSKLIRINIPDGVTIIGDYAFQSCGKLTSITIPDGVTYFGVSAFEYCSSLTSINISDGVTSIGDYAFRSCRSLTNITIPNSVTSIGDYAFEYCSSLTSINIPDSVTSIGNSAFDNCSNLTYNTYDNAKYLGNSQNPYVVLVSSATTDITSCEIHANTKIIYGRAFSDCTKLTSITIPDSVTSIGASAFSGCSGLESMTLPFVGGSRKTATDTYQYPFGYIFGTSSYTGGVATTQYYYGSSTLYTTSSTYYIPSSLKSVTITGGEILCCAFYNCSRLTVITIPDNITSIGISAFENCQSMTSITIPASVTSIGDFAFSDCHSLTSIIIPAGVTSIENCVFRNCISLTSITFPAGVTSIGANAFYNCSNLEEITFQGDAPKFGSSVLYGVSAKAYYPAGNPTWTSDVMGNYGGTINWVPYTSTKSRSYSGTAEPEGSVTAPEALSTSVSTSASTSSSAPEQKSLTLSGSTKTRTVTFEGLDPGEEYIFLSLVSENEANPLIYENLLFIDQLCADENGVITVSYRPRFASESVCELVRGGAVKNLAAATVTWPEYAGNDAQQFFAPTVSYDGKTLIENVDYVLEGELSFSVPGTYHCYVVGIGDYIGSYPCAYTVTEKIGDYSDGLSYTLSTKGDSYTVTGIGTCTDTEIIIPTQYNNLPVTGIGKEAFRNCSSLTSVTIPDSVTSIGDYVFYSCSSLTSITIPAGVTSIGISAFQYCSSLTSITIPAGVTSIGISAFRYCSSLTSITIPAGVTSIGTSAFSNCSSLTSITIPASVTSIGNVAFSNCSSLTSITIPAGVTSIGTNAFNNCSSLTSVTIPDSVTSIGDWAFNGCSNLTSITIPDSVTSIGNYAFQYCSSLTSITIPAGVTSIGSSVFNECSSLTSITIPDGVTSIGTYAFYNCNALTSITIPDGVTSIGNYAFCYCSNLTSITIPDSVTSIGNSAFYNCKALTSITIPASVTSIGNSAFYNCKALTSITIPASVTSIGNSVFRNCKALTSITIPGSVTSIGDWAFNGCSNLTSITIPGSVTSIGDWAFNGCSNLTSITIPGSVTSIGDYTFSNCSSLTSITIPGSVTSIGDYTFSNCSSLTSITIPDGVTSISDYAFYKCSSLTDVYYSGTQAQWDAISIGSYNDNLKNATLHVESGESQYSEGLSYTLSASGDSYIVTGIGTCTDTEIIIPTRYNNLPVTGIGNDAFRNCSSLTSVTIPDSVTSIGNSAFYRCSSLTGITIPAGVTSIGTYAFCGCSLTSITIPAGVTSIGNGVFSSCSSLTNITIPAGVSSIGSYAFSNCSNLTGVHISDIAAWCNISFEDPTSNPLYYAKELYLNGALVTELEIPNTVTSIGNYAFYNCTSLTSITIPAGVTCIGNAAFYDCSSLTSITIPDSVTSICSNAFRNCSSLTSITIPDSVTSIGNYAFYNCSSLTSITIPDSVTGIGENAFCDCSSLTSVAFGENSKLVSIGLNAFAKCSKLSDVTIPDGVTGIGYSAFLYCSSLTSITIPDSVTSIGNFAFAYCNNLKNIAIGENSQLTSIGEYAFRSCSMISITIPAGVTSIGNYAFEYCGNLTSVHISDIAAWCNISFGNSYSNPVSIAGKLYLNGTVVTKLEIPDSVTSIGNYAFYNCSSLTSITIPDSVTSVGYRAFSSCSKLTNITIPDSVTSIGEYAFYYCYKLTDVYYSGTQAQWDAISIGVSNDPLKNATLHTFWGITSVSLRPGAAGIYFTGSFTMSNSTAVKRQGIVVSLENENPVADGSDETCLWTTAGTSVLVSNILSTENTAAENARNSTKVIYARAYMELEDGTILYSDTVAVNLKVVVETIDKQWSNLADVQKDAILAMYATFSETMDKWQIPNLKTNS